ncbi:hypothetical protein DFQ27_009527 [Actinomortierella ambigua]|uniref:GDP-fucose protein O-fucosyltransferase 2 n=1 Tax=Actinomortierella ambigua TaxID=1343610 RepID=A0A9P6QIK0_9FUNG|nr:hypothetical protein DFQ27_009527 [Actinomortierella ambigua]
MSIYRSKQVLIVLVIISSAWLSLVVHRSYTLSLSTVEAGERDQQEQHSFLHDDPVTQPTVIPPAGPARTPTRTKGQIGLVAEQEAAPSTVLKDGVKYVSYLPYAGLTNQFIALQNAAYIARRLNRTLIIPPILANEHERTKSNQPWSEYFDLRRLKQETGIDSVEWHEVRKMTLKQKLLGHEQSRLKNEPLPKWQAIAQNLTCHVVYGYGDWESVHTTETSFLAQFLFKPVYKLAPPRKPQTIVYDRLKIGAKDNLHMEDIVDVDDLVDRYADNADQLLFFSHTFKIKDPKGRRAWPQAGVHFRFSQATLDYVTSIVSERVGHHVDEYIAVHLRRNDVVRKCTNPSGGNQSIYDCTPPMDWYAAEVEKARALAGDAALPVILTTDTRDTKDLEAIEKFGWYRIDHSITQTEFEVGTFGPAMIDSAILATARVLVGTSASTMSRTAAQRQKSWFNRDALFPRKAPPNWVPPSA